MTVWAVFAYGHTLVSLHATKESAEARVAEKPEGDVRAEIHQLTVEP